MLPTDYQSFIHQSRYSRWTEDKGRRENWSETVTRLIDFYSSYIDSKHSYQMSNKDKDSLFTSINDSYS